MNVTASPDAVQIGIAEWRAAIGEANVLDSTQALEAVATATFPTLQKVLAILHPASPEQVGECMRIAGRCGVPLYPVSAGCNWGLGSRVPAVDGCAVLDLGRMNAIVAFDPRMGTLTVEPGVTFRQVQDYLRQAGRQWFLPAIGGPADASVIGNLAERGDGSGPTGDRAGNACALQVVLPDGSRITTGFGMFDGASMATLSRTGPGPSLDGLFLQSGMGVLVGATLFLSPVLAHLALVRAHLTGRESLVRTIDTARALVRDGVLQPNCLSLWNATKVYMQGRSYPWAEMEGKTPLPIATDDAAQVWYLVATLHSASPAIGGARAAHAASALAASGVIVQVSDEADDPNLREQAEGALGGVSDLTAASVYWRKKSAPPSPLRPEADNCGVQWICLALRLDGTDFADVTRLIERTAIEHGFEAVISGFVASPRAIHLFVAIIYDRDIAHEDAAAQKCHDLVLTMLAERGIHPMRLGIQSMDHLSRAAEPYKSVMRRIRQALDPHRQVAPGRYEM